MIFFATSEITFKNVQKKKFKLKQFLSINTENYLSKI